MNSPLKAQVRLTDDQRRDLEQMARDGRTPARKARYARLLLHADAAHPEGQRPDAWIGQALGMHVNTVARVRKDFAAGDAAAALGRKPRDTPPVPPKIDGRVEAHLVALLCGPPPDYPKTRQGRCREVRLSSEAPLICHIDGEFFCIPEDNVRSLEIRLLPHALRVRAGLGTPGPDAPAMLC